jgi:hypothetical protein
MTEIDEKIRKKAKMSCRIEVLKRAE